MKRMKSEVKEKILSDFESALDKNNFNKALFLNNKDSLNIYKVTGKYPLFDSAYLYNENNIEIERKNKVGINHELLHAASRKKENATVYLGLAIYDDSKAYYLNYGLNEGLTEILDMEYFNGEKEGRAEYLYVNATKMVMNLVGDNYLIDCYFNADFKSFYKKISSLDNKKRALKLIMDIDELYSCELHANKKQFKKLCELYKKFLIDYFYIILTYAFNEYYHDRLIEENLDILIDYIEDYKYNTININGKDIHFFRESELMNIIEKTDNKVFKRVIK